MQGPGHQFLAGTGFAGDKDGQIGSHQPRQNTIDILHGRGTSDKRQLLVGFSRRDLAAIRRILQRPVDDADQFAQVERFRQVFVCAALVRLDRSQKRALGAHHDDLYFGADFPNSRHQVQTVLVRHYNIGNHQVPFAIGDPGPQRAGIARQADLVTLAGQRAFEDRTNGTVVIRDENCRFGCHVLGSSSESRSR